MKFALVNIGSNQGYPNLSQVRARGGTQTVIPLELQKSLVRSDGRIASFVVLVSHKLKMNYVLSQYRSSEPMAIHESKIYKGLKTKIILPVCSEKKTAAVIFCGRWVQRLHTERQGCH